MSTKTLGDDLHVTMNPEFLREGTAVEDFQNPDKVDFGTNDDLARTTLHEVFEPLIQRTDAPIVETGVKEA